MNNAIVKHEDQPSILAVISRAAADHNVDVAKMQALLDMHTQVTARVAEGAFNEAMARLQPKMPVVEKNGTIYVNGELRSRFAKYEDIDEAVRPQMAAEGFSISYNTRAGDGKNLTITARLRHAMGHSEHYELTLPVDASGAKNPTQGMGSTVSFGKRYLLCMALNIVAKGEDSDGELSLPINPAQVKSINDLIKAYGVDERKFCEFLKVADVKAIQQCAFRKAVNALNSKRPSA